jgi:hypothetical protein
LKKVTDNEKKKEKQFALIIAGDSLITIFNEEQLKGDLVKIGDKCKAVLGCRVSPK